MTRNGRSMAMVGTLLLAALAVSEAWPTQLDGVPTIQYGPDSPQVVNSRDWVRRAIPSFCRKPDYIYAASAPRLLARPLAYRLATPLSIVTPVMIITEEEEARLGFAP